MFGRYKTIRRLRTDAEKVIIPKIPALETAASNTHFSKRWVNKTVIRFAASFGVLFFVFLFGIMPVLHNSHTSSKNDKYNFELTVCAADQSIVLKSQTKVTLISGRIIRKLITNNDTNESSYGYGYESSYFSCTGKDVETVSYKDKLCQLNFVYNWHEQSDHQVIIQMPDTFVYNWGPPEEMKTEFVKVWNSGQLDYYKNKYFEGKDINLDDYCVGAIYGTDKHTYTLALVKKVNKNTNYNIITNTIEVWSGDNVQWLAGGLLNAHLPENNNPTPPDYSKLPHDTLTVTATFKNGESVTKTVDISFDKEGNLVCELIDN